jgi:hypothetical protein
VRRALAEARRRVGPAALDARTLGDACQSVEVLVVARRLEHEAEFLRFDRCQLVARATADAATLPTVIAARLATERLERAPEVRRRSGRAPWAISGAGVAVAVAGAILVVLGKNELDRLDDSPCGRTGTCDPASYSGSETRQNVGWGLLAVGATSLVAGLVWTWLRRDGTDRSTANLASDWRLGFQF